MQIEYRTGNMFEGPEHVLIHGCNAKGVMGSGVAKTVRDDYPVAYDTYRDAFLQHGLRLGTVIWANCPDRQVGDRLIRAKRIGNAITQADFGRDPGRVYVDYEAIRAVIRTVEVDVRWSQMSRDPEWHIHAVAMPLIGAGLANGHWPTIAKIIEEETQSFTPVVYVLPGQKVPT